MGGESPLGWDYVHPAVLGDDLERPVCPPGEQWQSIERGGWAGGEVERRIGCAPYRRYIGIERLPLPVEVSRLCGIGVLEN